jgi:hypothetical protein
MARLGTRVAAEEALQLIAQIARVDMSALGRAPAPLKKTGREPDCLFGERALVPRSPFADVSAEDRLDVHDRRSI